MGAPMKIPTRKRRILVVDDDVARTRLPVERLCRAGHDVSATHTAQEAIGAVAVSAPDLALVDVRLSGDPGLILGTAVHSEYDVAYIIPGLGASTAASAPCRAYPVRLANRDAPHSSRAAGR